MGIAKKVNMIAFNTTMGLTQGGLPLIAYNYGARKYERMEAVIRFTAGVALGFTICCTVFFRLFTGRLITFFISDPDSVAFGTRFLSVLAFAAPLCALSYMANTIFQAAGDRRASFILSIMRKGVVDIPAMYIFKMLIGLNGVVWATPFAEVTSAVTASVLYMRFKRRVAKMKEEK
jgi:Na+-driven multidrug efflux pump